MGDWKDGVFVTDKYHNEFRNILCVYKKALDLICSKQKSFKRIALHLGTPIKDGVNKFLQYEKEIAELERVYMEIELFKAIYCDEEDRVMLDFLIEQTPIPEISKQLSISPRTSYRRIAKITQTFFEKRENLGVIKKCQKHQNQQNQQQTELWR